MALFGRVRSPARWVDRVGAAGLPRPFAVAAAEPSGGQEKQRVHARGALWPTTASRSRPPRRSACSTRPGGRRPPTTTRPCCATPRRGRLTSLELGRSAPGITRTRCTPVRFEPGIGVAGAITPSVVSSAGVSHLNALVLLAQPHRPGRWAHRGPVGRSIGLTARGMSVAYDRSLVAFACERLGGRRLQGPAPPRHHRLITPTDSRASNRSRATARPRQDLLDRYSSAACETPGAARPPGPVERRRAPRRARHDRALPPTSSRTDRLEAQPAACHRRHRRRRAPPATDAPARARRARPGITAALTSPAARLCPNRRGEVSLAL